MPPPAGARADAALIAARRMMAQRLSGAAPASPERVVAELGPIQAQDYGAARWAVGLRQADGDAASEARVEEALAAGRIVRVHALRGTWQLIAPADVRWILALIGGRFAGGSTPRHRELGLDAATFRRSRSVFAKALRGAELTRAELSAALRRAGITAVNERLSHLLGYAELAGLLCTGARRGKQQTYALIDDRVPPAPRALDREEAAAELARRYFTTRGPATLTDFTWWSGLPAAEARAALEVIRRALVAEEAGGRTYWRSARALSPPPAAADAHLLPAFDEYLVAYQSREVALDPAHARAVNDGGGMLKPAVVVGGRVLGTWRRTLARAGVAVAVDLFAAPTRAQRAAIADAARRFGTFLGLAATLAIRVRQPAARARARAGSSSG